MLTFASFFLLESRVAGDQLRAAERQAARAKRPLTLEPAAATAAGSLSAGLGIAVRTHLGHAPSPAEHLDPKLESRVKFSWMGGAHLISANFRAAEGYSRRRPAVLEPLAIVIRRLHGPWGLTADWNLLPQELSCGGWPSLVRGLCADRQSADLRLEGVWLLVDARLHPLVWGVGLVRDIGARPRPAVRLWLGGKPRRHTVRVLRPPRMANPAPPHGCLNCTADTDWESILGHDSAQNASALDAGFGQWVSCVEAQIADIEGLAGRERAAMCSRAAGPRFVMQPHLGKPGSC